jgi:acetyl esterase
MWFAGDTNSKRMREALDPEAKKILDLMEEAGVPPVHSLSVEGARQSWAENISIPDEPEPVDEVRELEIPSRNGSLTIRVYTPEGEGPFPGLLYFHAGGWAFGTLDVFDSLCRALTNEAECVVVSVDYKLAPENKFPAGLQDAYAATEWVEEYAPLIDVDPDRIAVSGESAGGNLATSVALMARDRDGPSLVHQLLLYPVTDHALDTESHRQFDGEGDAFYAASRKDMEWCWDLYTRTEIDAHNKYASPLRARDLSGLPSATVMTSEFDPLRDEGVAYAERLDNSGVDTEHVMFEEMFHGFLNMVEHMDRAREGIEMAADHLQRGFE